MKIENFILKKWKDIAGLLLVFLLLLLSARNPARAESPGRIYERVSNYWEAPASEDYHDFIHYLELLTAKDGKYSNVENDKTLSAIKEILNQANISKATRAGLMIRLTQLNSENIKIERDKALKAYRSRYEKWLSSEKSNLNDIPEEELAVSQGYARKAISAYRDLFNQFPKFNNDPELTYRMGNLQLLTRNPNAELYFEKVIKKHPKTIWARKALLGLGEFHFNKKDWANAKKYYSKAAKTGILGISDYANYKLAWVYAIDAFADKGLKRASLAKAESAFRRLATGSASSSPEFRGSKSFSFLRQEILNDLVWLWSESQDFDSAASFFLNVAKSKNSYFNLVERMGWKFELANNAKNAASFYHIIFKKNPERKNHIRLQLQLIELFFKSDQPMEVLKETQALSKTLANLKGPWYQAHKKNSSLQRSMRRRTHDLLIDKSTFYNKAYYKSKNDSYLKVTSVLYALYLYLFPRGTEAATIRFRYAITLEQLGNKEGAVLQYHNVVRSKRTNSEQRSYAAEKMISIQSALVASIKFPTLPSPGSLRKPVAIPKQKKILIDVSDTYLVHFSSNAKSSKLRFDSAKTMFDYGHYKGALQRFQDTVRLNPNSVESKQTVQIVLGYFDSIKNWFSLASWSEKFIKFERHLGPKISAYIISMLKKGMWQIAVTYKAQKKYRKSADAFLAYQKRLPSDEIADKALFNAMSLYFSLGDGKKGIKIGKLLLKVYPKSLYGANTLIAVGRAFQSLNQYRSAAESFEKFSLIYPKDQRTPEILYQAAGIYKGLRNLDRSALLLGTISSKYPSSKFAPKSLLETADINLKLDQFSKAANSYQMYLNKYAKLSEQKTVFARAQVAVLTTPNIPASAEKPVLLQLEKALQSKPRNYAVEARVALTKFYLDITEALILDFEQQKVAYYDFNEYKSSIDNYTRYIIKLENFFGRLLRIASTEGLSESYYKLGLVYEQAISAFTQKWNMDGLRPEEARDILNARERITLSLREKLLNAFKNSYRSSKANKVFTSYRNLALEKLSILEPGSYRGVKEGTMSTGGGK